MKKGAAALIGIPLIIVGIITVFYVVSKIPSYPKIPLVYGKVGLQENTENYVMRLTVSLPPNHTILYDCRVEVRYLTQDGTWKTSSRNFGSLIHGSPFKELTLQLHRDFKSGNPNLKQDGLFHEEVEPNIKIEAYGYTKP